MPRRHAVTNIFTNSHRGANAPRFCVSGKKTGSFHNSVGVTALLNPYVCSFTPRGRGPKSLSWRLEPALPPARSPPRFWARRQRGDRTRMSPGVIRCGGKARLRGQGESCLCMTGASGSRGRSFSPGGRVCVAPCLQGPGRGAFPTVPQGFRAVSDRPCGSRSRETVSTPVRKEESTREPASLCLVAVGSLYINLYLTVPGHTASVHWAYARTACWVSVF